MNDIAVKQVTRCLECGKELIFGRVGKKFCSSECKNRFHNRLVQSSRCYRAKVTHALSQNYEILSGLIKSRVNSIDLGDLVQMGFNLEYCTSYRKVRSHDEYRCYDIRYYRTASRIFNIIKLD